MEPDQDQKEPSSCESVSATLATLDEEERPVASKEDREIARWALGERMKRKHPKQPIPRWFDRGDVEMVARCSAALEGDRAAKEQAQREAMAGAFSASKEGPPTARFTWEKLEHFFEHVERGRKELRNEALDAQRRAGEKDKRSRRVWGDAINTAGERARRSPHTRAELAAIRAEFEELAARTAPEFRGYIDSMVAQYRALEAKARE
jgi:hypothetical protein